MIMRPALSPPCSALTLQRQAAWLDTVTMQVSRPMRPSRYTVPPRDDRGCTLQGVAVTDWNRSSPVVLQGAAGLLHWALIFTGAKADHTDEWMSI